jgi:hypothetical protein
MRAVLIVLAALGGGCDPTDIHAVGDPGGVYRPGAGCVLEDLEAGGARNCPGPAQLGFEQLADAALFEPRTANLSRRQVSCRRSWCGTGALALHADYRWREGMSAEAAETDRLGEIRHSFPQPVDLYGKSLAFAVYVDGPLTPINAYIAVIERGGRFRMVNDGVLYTQFPRWSLRGGAIRADNPALELSEGATSLLVTDLVISVYLATPVHTGDRQSWSGDIYIDDVGWQ